MSEKKRVVVGMVEGVGLKGEKIEEALAGQLHSPVLLAVIGHLEAEWLALVNEETDPALDLPTLRGTQGRREMCAVLVRDLVTMAGRAPKG
jgi:hypothetical protein